MLDRILELCLVTMLLSTQNVFAQDAKFRVPLNGSVTTQCTLNSVCASKSTSTARSHTGLDYNAASKDILASNVGKIVKIQLNGSSDHGLGNTIIIEHKIVNAQGGNETLYSQYSHLESFIPGLYEGEAVTKGQKIGTMGGTGHGRIEWPVHLHFEIKRAAVIHNPTGGAACTYEGGVKDVCWGYTPGNAADYGYIDPAWIISSNTIAIGNDYAYWEFNGAGNFEGWLLKNIEAGSVNNGILFDDPQTGDPQIVSPEIFVDASVLKYLKFRMASNAPDRKGTIFFKTTGADGSYAPDKQISFDVRNPEFAMSGNAPFNDYSIPLTHQKWTGKITGIRIDPAEAGATGTNKDSIGIDWIRLSPNP